MFKTIRAAGVTAAALFLCANASQASAQTAAIATPAATVSPSVHAAAPAQVSSTATNPTAAATNAATPAVAIVHASADTSLTPVSVRDGDQIVTPQGVTAIVGRARPDRASDVAPAPAQTAAFSLASLVEQHAAAESEDEQFQCLASAVYFESRGEPLEGQLAVAEVILNRVASGRFRGTVCDVVTQPSQFSFVRGGRIPEPNRTSAAWSRAVAIARIAMDNLHDVTGDDSLFFHATYVRPSWGRPSARIARIGNHIFYR
ncbi:cell wall hydrolase [Sphingosinicella sp. YJ22]|uniref:cell wall hydrolase n=1 Tax=Sphingosinicella sp. YJ22 TaxID=1104780 RepID=UPI001409F93F|nr:cell wall hydrolase [Sphingosinicella sp. YJ22]